MKLPQNPWKYASFVLIGVVALIAIFGLSSNNLGSIKEQVRSYNDTTHEEYFSYGEKELFAIIAGGLPSQNIQQKQLQALEAMVQFWSQLPTKGNLDEKRALVLSPLLQLLNWKKTYQRPEGVKSYSQLEDAYLAAYKDFLYTIFPDGEISESYNAGDFKETFEFYLK